MDELNGIRVRESRTRTALDAALMLLAQTERRLKENQAKLRAVELEREALRDELQQVYASRSWRLTAPLRGIAARNPLRGHLAANFIDRYRAVSEHSARVARAAWRLVTLRSPAQREPALPPVATVPVTEVSPVAPGASGASAARVEPALLRYDLLQQAGQWCVETDPDVSIIIVNRNAAEMTCACVRHVWESTTGTTYEIIIVDSGSERGNLDILRGAGPGVRLIELGANRYFGEANNIGVEAARGQYVCLLNNDAFVTSGWLGELLRVLNESPEAGAVGPVFLFPDGTIQEAGGHVRPDGIPVRALRGEPETAAAGLADHAVDYISAACLLLPRALFIEAGGFDLAYEPACYEDTDFCFKLAALGRKVMLAPQARVYHIEGFSTGEDAVLARREQALGDLNREKFLARWGDYLRRRDEDTLRSVREQVLRPAAVQAGPRPVRRAVVYSQYPLTPGGGGRYLLSIAATLTSDYSVTIATEYPYSRLRLHQLSNELRLDLDACELRSRAEIGDGWEVAVAMGNHVFPPIPALGRRSFFHCQFPFPLLGGMEPQPELLAGYEAIIVNSDYVRRCLAAIFERDGLRPCSIEVAYPPVPQVPEADMPKKPIILSVGRFFLGGHSKRHDLLIEAFRALSARWNGPLEFHIAGSSTPEPAHMDYLSELRRQAAGLPVTFHVNAAQSELETLYQQAAFYWHGAGLGEDLALYPERAEHFGIAIVEGMSAGCASFAFAAGGIPEVITDGVDGCLYTSTEALIERTLALLRDPPARAAMGARARRRAADFTEEAFATRIRALLA